MKFYFTYGTDGQPFVGGWTEVEAPTARAAAFAFRTFHPDKTEGLLNCSDMYPQAVFEPHRDVPRGQLRPPVP